MASLSRSSFLNLAAVPLAKETVDVPSLGGSVTVAELNAGERDAFEASHAEAGGKDFRARLVVAAVRDDLGRPLFKVDDIPALSKLPVGALDPIVEAAVRIGKMSAKEVEALEKN